MEIAEWATDVFARTGEALSPKAHGKEEEIDPLELSGAGALDISRLASPEPEEQVVKVEKRWVRVIKSFDGYGDSDDKYDPVSHPKVRTCSVYE